MRIDQVPQDDSPILAGHRKGVYARDAAGRLVLVPSSGWEAEEIATRDALAALAAQSAAARAAVQQGHASPLACWMSHCRMDLALLSQSTGLWRWRVRRHLQAKHFVRLSPALLQRYAEALGISVAQLQQLPP